MKKARLIAGVTAAIPAAAGFAAPAAHATQTTTTLAHQAPAKGKTVRHYGIRPDTGPGWYEVSYPETLYFRDGGSYPYYSGQVYVTCYYSGAPGPDPYWDHFTKYISPTRYGGIVRSRAGHLADAHVDLNGHLPRSYGIPHC